MVEISGDFDNRRMLLLVRKSLIIRSFIKTYIHQNRRGRNYFRLRLFCYSGFLCWVWTKNCKRCDYRLIFVQDAILYMRYDKIAKDTYLAVKYWVHFYKKRHKICFLQVRSFPDLFFLYKNNGGFSKNYCNFVKI